MGGFFSLDGRSPLADSQVDANSVLDSSPAGVTAPASHHPGAASLAESSMSTRDDSMGTFASVTDAASNSGSEAVGPAERTQGS